MIGKPGADEVPTIEGELIYSTWGILTFVPLLIKAKIFYMHYDQCLISLSNVKILLKNIHQESISDRRNSL